MSTTPRGRSSPSSHRRIRCKCAGGGGGRGGGDRAKSCCFNPLRSLFRCPGRCRGRRSRSRSRSRAPSRVRDASPDVATEQQGQEASFFVYAMPSQARAGEHKKKHRKAPRLPSIRSCFRKKKKERKAAARRQPLTPAPSMVTHPPRSPPPQENAHAVAPAQTQPPSPAVTENGSTYSPAPVDRKPATPRPGKQSTDSARSPFPPQRRQSTDSARSVFPPQRQQPRQVDGLQIVEVATGERLSAHDVGLIEMVGGSTDDSAESSMKSSLEYINEPPSPAPAKRAAAERVATVVKAREPPELWLNGHGAKAGTGARFAEPLVLAAADELWAHDIACSRAHAAMLAETVSFLYGLA